MDTNTNNTYGIIMTNRADASTLSLVVVDGKAAAWQNIIELIAAGTTSGVSVAGANTWDWRAVEMASINVEKVRGLADNVYGVAVDGTKIGRSLKPTKRMLMREYVRMTSR